MYFLTSLSSLHLTFPPLGICSRAAHVWMQVSGLPGKASEELFTQEPSPMLGKYHSGQEKLQQAWSFMGCWLHALQ